MLETYFNRQLYVVNKLLKQFSAVWLYRYNTDLFVVVRFVSNYTQMLQYFLQKSPGTKIFQ